MILQFPNAETLTLAISSGLIPADAVVAPAIVSSDGTGRIAVETEFQTDPSFDGHRAGLGIESIKRHLGPETEISCWPQAVPLVKEMQEPVLTQQTPVLFECHDESTFSDLVREIIRLGNDRQTYAAYRQDDGGSSFQLRVVGPPYYSLLRAVDRQVQGESIRAYLEKAPRVWVEFGYSHPLAGTIQPGERHRLLIRHPRDWRSFDETHLRDIYELLSFDLPKQPEHWIESPQPRIVVPLKLVPGNAQDVPELWVIPGSAEAELDAFIRDADERLIQRLRFLAVQTPAGDRLFLLKAVASRQPPPVIALEAAVGYRPYQKFPNLFVPTGQRLHPVLRREAVRSLLLDSPDELVWLAPEGRDGFTPHSADDRQFRPLEDWVDYVIAANREPLQVLIDASTFEFDSFLCTEKQSPPRSESSSVSRTQAVPPPKREKAAPVPNAAAPVKPKPPAPEPAATAPEPPKPQPPSAWKKRRTELEAEFLKSESEPLDSPARTALWPLLAECHSALDDRADGAICYQHSLWSRDDETMSRNWAALEWGKPLDSVAAPDWDRLLQSESPNTEDVRRVAASVTGRIPRSLTTRIPAVQQFLDRHFDELSARAAWLAACGLSRASGSDPLGLARTRDRLLQRLLDQGLQTERDLPTFLRYASAADSDRVRAIRTTLPRLHAAVQAWTAQGLTSPSAYGSGDTVNTPALIDLTFAYAYARLHETSTARQLRERAVKILTATMSAESTTARVIANSMPWLARAYSHRIDQALSGQTRIDPLPESIQQELSDLRQSSERYRPPANAAPTGIKNPLEMAHFALCRFLERSRLLEPTKQRNPFDTVMKYDNELQNRLQELPQIRQPAALTRAIRDLLSRETGRGRNPLADQQLILQAALPHAPRAGEALTRELLAQVPELFARMAAAPFPADAPADLGRSWGELLESTMLLAVHFNAQELARDAMPHFLRMLPKATSKQWIPLINALDGRILLRMRKYGLEREIAQLLNNLQSLIFPEQPIVWANVLRLAGESRSLGELLQALVKLAASWQALGTGGPVEETFDFVAREMLGRRVLLKDVDFAIVSRTYLSACHALPLESTLTRLCGFFDTVPPGRVGNATSTAPYYSLHHTVLAEAAVLALIDHDAVSGNELRWRDEDEYLIRRRIHADTARAAR